jgi:hypothetical protein
MVHGLSILNDRCHLSSHNCLRSIFLTEKSKKAPLPEKSRAYSRGPIAKIMAANKRNAETKIKDEISSGKALSQNDKKITQNGVYAKAKTSYAICQLELLVRQKSLR